MARYHEKVDFLKFTDKNANYSYEDLKKEKKLLISRSFIGVSTLETTIEFSDSIIKPVFIDGVQLPYFVSKSGQIISLAKIIQRRRLNKKGYFYYKTRSVFYDGVKSRNIHNIVAEAFLLPKGDNIKCYHVLFKDGNKQNCHVDNLKLVKRGNVGVAIKKQISVFKDGVLFAVFDSVTRCAEALNIPRRRISEFLKATDKTVKGLSFKYE